MAEQFQHIKVVPVDDEIVIQAGARKAAVAEAEVAPVAAVPVEVPAAVAPVEVPAAVAPAEAPAVPVSPSQSSPSSPAAAAPDAASAEDEKAEEQLRTVESGLQNLSWAVHAAIAEEHAANPRPARMAYRETTLEDLESAPMPRMQKIVLALLGGGVAVFGVYCILRFGLHLF